MNFYDINKILKKRFEGDPNDLSDFQGDVEGIGKIENKEHKGGEGEGDEYYDILYAVDHGVYIKVSGSYYSYNGTEYEDWDSAVKEVRPIEKTITVYE